MHIPLEYSEHALVRMAQRGFTNDEIEYVCLYGRRFYCAGMVHCFLGWRDIPRSDWRNPCVERLEGLTVLLDRETRSLVVTVYRNKRASRQIRRKAKIDLSRRSIH